MRKWINLVESIAPQYLYHGTWKSNLPEIKAHGLEPSRSKSSLQAIFLAGDAYTADNYQYQQDHGSGEWRVLKIDLSQLDPSLLGPDNYELPDMLAQNGDPRDWDECSWQDSLEICCQVAYYGVIPSSAILGIVAGK